MVLEEPKIRLSTACGAHSSTASQQPECNGLAPRISTGPIWSPQWTSQVRDEQAFCRTLEWIFTGERVKGSRGKYRQQHSNKKLLICYLFFFFFLTMVTNEGRAVKNYAVHQSMRIPVALHSNQSAMTLLHTRRSPFLIKLTPRPGKCPLVHGWGICRKISGFCVMGFMKKT